MQKYYVVKNLKHDTQSYVPGEQVELSDDAAQPLLADGVIQTAKPVEVQLPENLERVQKSPKKPKAGKDEPKVGGEPATSGEPSIDGSSEPTAGEAADMTPPVEEAKDISADL